MKDENSAGITEKQVFWVNDFMRNSLEFEDSDESAREFMTQEFGLTKAQVDIVMSNEDEFRTNLYFQLSLNDFS
jgi:hypothetical protein